MNYIIIILAISSCCPLTNYYFAPKNTVHPGKGYIYEDFSGEEIISSLKILVKNNPKYLVPIQNIDRSIIKDIYRNIDTMRYSKSNNEERLEMRIEGMGRNNSNTLYSFYFKEKNLIITTYIFYGEKDTEPYSRYFIYLAYILPTDNYITYKEMTCEQRSEITSIFEEEIISKLDSTLKSNYPDRIIDWD